MMFSLLLLGSALGAQPAPRSVWVRALDPADRAVLSHLGLGFAESTHEGWLNMHADDEGLERLRRSGLSWRPDRRQARPGDGYLEPAEMNDALRDLALEAPERVELVSLGTSVEGRAILAVRISDTDMPVLNWRILGGHHGDETSSAELPLESARWLARASGGPLAALLARDAVWVVPHVNPDGVAYHTRYNANGVDLNRNYDYQWSPTEFRSGTAPFSEPETRNVRALSSWIPFGAGLSTHSGATNIGWVWNFTVDPTTEADLLENIADAYAEECRIDDFWTTNGASWYITHGDTTDWAFGRYGTLDYTLEVSLEKSPNPDDIEVIIEAHQDAVEAFLDWPWIVGGQVVDADTGEGLPATVMFDDGRPMLTGPTGHFGRPVLDGEHTLSVVSHGYAQATLTATTGAGPLHVALVRDHIERIRPDPALLPADDIATFSIDVETEELRLIRPGHASVELLPTPDGWQVDTTGLSPGPWSIATPSSVSPRAVFVGDADPGVRIDAVSIGDPAIALTGDGFGEGTRAWALWGDVRAPEPVRVLDETDTTLLIELSPRPPEDETVDLLVLTSGHQVPVLDVFRFAAEVEDEGEDDTATRDTDSPSESPTEGDVDPTPIVGSDSKLRAVGCSVAPGYPGVALLVSLLGLIPFRRLRCTTS